MKKLPVLLVAALAGVLAANVTSAADSASAYTCAPATVSASKPAPIYVVPPVGLPSDLEGTTVHLAFTIDEKGVPHNVRPVDAVTNYAARQLVSAVSQWRFQPRMVNGKPVATRVVLPLALAGEA